MTVSVGGAAASLAWLPWDQRHAVAAELDRSAPTPALAGRVARLDPAELGEVDLVEAIAACDRLAAWLAELQARFVAALVDHTPSSSLDHVPDEIATRLGTTRRAAEHTVELATGLRAHPLLADAMASGTLSARKAQVLLQESDHLPARLATAVLERVLVGAEERTAPQLRRDVRAAELEIDAEAAALRHRSARAERGVRMAPAPDAMAWIHALLPAADATTVMTAIGALADRREPGEERTADQRRADALTALARRVLDSGRGLDGVPLPRRQRRRPHLEVTVSAGTLRAADDAGAVAHLTGYGLVPFCAVAGIAEDAELHVLRVDAEGLPVGGAAATDGYRPSAELVREVVVRDRTCRFHGCDVAAERCDIDHITPFDPRRPAYLQTMASNLQALCRRHHRLKTHGGWYASRDPVSGATLWRSPTGRIHIVSPEPVLPAGRPPPASPTSTARPTPTTAA